MVDVDTTLTKKQILTVNMKSAVKQNLNKTEPPVSCRRAAAHNHRFDHAVAD